MRKRTATSLTASASNAASANRSFGASQNPRARPASIGKPSCSRESHAKNDRLGGRVREACRARALLAAHLPHLECLMKQPRPDEPPQRVLLEFTLTVDGGDIREHLPAIARDMRLAFEQAA